MVCKEKVKCYNWKSLRWKGTKVIVRSPCKDDNKYTGLEELQSHMTFSITRFNCWQAKSPVSLELVLLCLWPPALPRQVSKVNKKMSCHTSSHINHKALSFFAMQQKRVASNYKVKQVLPQPAGPSLCPFSAFVQWYSPTDAVILVSHRVPCGTLQLSCPIQSKDWRKSWG